jgi:hypothetical protein
MKKEDLIILIYKLEATDIECKNTPILEEIIKFLRDNVIVNRKELGELIKFKKVEDKENFKTKIQASLNLETVYEIDTRDLNIEKVELQEYIKLNMKRNICDYLEHLEDNK